MAQLISFVSLFHMLELAAAIVETGNRRIQLLQFRSQFVLLLRTQLTISGMVYFISMS